MTAKAGNVETDLKLRKFNIIQHVSTTDSIEFIEALEEILRLQRIADYEKKIKTPISREAYEQKILEAHASVERGEGISQEDLIKELEEQEGRSILED